MHSPITISIEPKVVGSGNGIKIDWHSSVEAEILKQFRADYGNSKYFLFQDKLSDLNLPILRGRLEKRAILTDLMKYYTSELIFNWIISERAYSLFSHMNLGFHRVFDVEIGNTDVTMKLFTKRFITLQEINFPQSVLFSGIEEMGNYKEYVFESCDDFITGFRKNSLMDFKIIAIDKKHQEEDILFIQMAVRAFFSEKLLDMWSSLNFTGLERKKMPELVFV